MGKRREGKKRLLLITLVAIIAIILLVVIIVKIVNTKEPEKPVDKEQLVYELPDTTYNDMDVINVIMEYLKDNNETSISLQIFNKTEVMVENESVEIVWINANGETVTQMPVLIEKIEPRQAQNFEFIAKGDLTTTAQIKIQKK